MTSGRLRNDDASETTFPRTRSTPILQTLGVSSGLGLALGGVIVLVSLSEEPEVSTTDVVASLCFGFAIGVAHGLFNLLLWKLGAMRWTVVLDEDLLIRSGKKVIHTVPRREIVLAKLHPQEITPINLWLGGYLEEPPRLNIYCRDGRHIPSGPLFIRELAEGQEIQDVLDTYVRGARRT